MSYIIPTEDLTLSDKRAFRDAAVEKAIKLAISFSIAGGNRSALRVRHAQNIADFGTGLDQWRTAVLAAPIGANYSVFQLIAAPTLAVNKVAVFYKAGVQTAPNPLGLLSFRTGAAAGSTYAVFDLQQLNMALVTEGYFTEPVVYGPQEVLNIVAMAVVATAAFATLILGCFIIEPANVTLS